MTPKSSASHAPAKLRKLPFGMCPADSDGSDDDSDAFENSNYAENAEVNDNLKLQSQSTPT
jgi:hypothetical protein